jgi:hypothetical protein
MEALAGVVGSVAVMAAIIIVPSACLNWVLGPLDRAAKNRWYPIQFGLADLLCLFVLIQLPVGLMHWTLHDMLGKGVVVLDVLLGVAATLVWWVCVRTLSRAGIHVVWQRCAVLTLVMPGTYASTLALIGLPIAVVALFVEHHPAIAGWLLLVEVILPFVLYGLGRCTRAVVAATKDKDVMPKVILCENSEEPTVHEERQP